MLGAGDRDRRICERLESGQRRAAPLDRARILLDGIVEVLVRPDYYVAPLAVLGCQSKRKVRSINFSWLSYLFAVSQSINNEKRKRD